MEENKKNLWLNYEKQETKKDKELVLNRIKKLSPDMRHGDGTFKYLKIDDVINIIDEVIQFKDEVYFY